MDQVKLHGFAASTYTRTARMAAMEKGIAHELVPIAYGEPEHFALHPFGKMPILTDGKVTLFETLAIVAYLDGKLGAPSLFGTNTAEKALILSAVSVAIDYVYRDVVQIEAAENELSASQIPATARVFDWLEKRLKETRHVASAELSAADLFFAPMMAYHVKQFGDDKVYHMRARLEGWMISVEERPSFQKTVE